MSEDNEDVDVEEEGEELPPSVSVVAPAELPPENREFLDSAISVLDAMGADKIAGFYIYAWGTDDGDTFYDSASYKRGGINPHLFADMLKNAIDKNV